MIDLDLEAVEGLLVRAAERMPPEDHALLQALVENHVYLVRLLHARGTTIARLRHLFALRSSEKTAEVLGNHSGASGSAASSPSPPTGRDPAP